MSADASIVAARPAAPNELVLLFHGVGASARGLLPLADVIAQARPQAMVVSVEAPFTSDFGTGSQWFSVQGITEENRPERIAEAMPLFLETVRRWQADARVSVEATTLVGFSQGAIMALESTQVDASPARRIVSLSGRFASDAKAPQHATVFHFIHGDRDMVVPTDYSRRAAERLRQLGAGATLDIVPALAHGIDARVAALVTQYLDR